VKGSNNDHYSKLVTRRKNKLAAKKDYVKKIDRQ